jgi:PEP-CTERM motif
VANGSLSNNAVIGLDNVVFQTSAVPEPSTYAMMLGGLGLLAFMARRKRA